jgi:hypothetical protein
MSLYIKNIYIYAFDTCAYWDCSGAVSACARRIEEVNGTVSPGEALGKLIKGNSYFIILAAVLLMLMAITSAQGVQMATGIETMVFKDTQLYKDIDYYNENFQATTFLILITSDDVLNPQVIEAMQRLDSQIRANQWRGPRTYSMAGTGYLRPAEQRGQYQEALLSASGGTVQISGAGPAPHDHDGHAPG